MDITELALDLGQRGLVIIWLETPGAKEAGPPALLTATTTPDSY